MAAPEASASVSGCLSPAAPNRDSGSGHVKSGRKAPLRQFPTSSSSCPTVGKIDSSVKLYYHCVYFNGANWWTHLRVEGTSVQGWMYNGNLNDDGASKPCIH